MTELFLWIIATITITIWQIVLAVKIFGVRHKDKTVTTNIISQDKRPISVNPVKPSVVDIDISKNLKIGSADTSNVKSDETIRGKVKTQKNKLKQLRNM